MTFWLAIRRMLPVLAVLGLVLGPFTAPAVAGRIGATVSGPAAGGGSAMGDTDCCPPEQPVMPDCMKSCPLPALCQAATLQDVPAMAVVLVSVGIAATFVPSSDAAPDTLAQGPPTRPPKA